MGGRRAVESKLIEMYQLHLWLQSKKYNILHIHSNDEKPDVTSKSCSFFFFILIIIHELFIFQSGAGVRLAFRLHIPGGRFQ